MSEPDYERIRDTLPKTQDEVRVQRMWRRIEAKRGASPSKRSRQFGALAFVALSVLAVGVYRHGMSSSLVIEGGASVSSTLVADGQGRRIAFSDGSVLALGAGTRLDVIARTPARFELALRRGEVAFDVRSEGTPSWQVDCAGIAITFGDAAFAVERGAAELVLHVRRGVIVLRGDPLPDRVLRLVAGVEHRVRLVPAVPRAPSEPSNPRNATTVVDTDVTEAVTARAGANDGEGRPRSHGSVATPAVPVDWQSAFAEGQYRDAYAALGSAGLALETSRVDRVEDLFALADVARLSGHPRDAMHPLTRIVEQYPSDPRAGMASYTIAQLELDRLGRPREAAVAYARAMTLGLPRSMHELATARRVEALGRAGAPDVVSEAAAYLASYPDGRYRAEVSRWLTR